MKAVFVDTGQDPRWETLALHKITRVYFPMSDPVVDVRRRLEAVRDRGLVGGLMAAWNWQGYGTDGPSFADAVHNRLKLIAPAATNTWPKIILDDEEHDPDRIVQELRRWRQLRPNTDTAWTLESMQGGWFAPGLVEQIVASKVRVVPQCYTGPMAAVDTLAAARDLTKMGVPDALVTPMYDAAQLPQGWDGFAFTAGRLPG